MLGLGTGLIRSALRSPIMSYYSDFSSDANGVIAYSVQDSDSDLVLTANQNPSSDGGPNESGWLKGVYGVNQTNTSGIQIDVGESPMNFDSQSGYEWVYTGQLFIVDGSDWSNFSSIILTSTQVPGTSSGNKEVTPGQVYNWYHQRANVSSGSDTALGPKWGSTQKPQAGATFYVKNITITIYG